jgi:hypothetical protein
MHTLADRLLLLAFELRLAGWQADEVAILYDAAIGVSEGPQAASEPLPDSQCPPNYAMPDPSHGRTE